MFNTVAYGYRSGDTMYWPLQVAVQSAAYGVVSISAAASARDIVVCDIESGVCIGHRCLGSHGLPTYAATQSF